MRKLIETGRAEFRGAAVRFKERGTLEAHDRNLADLSRLRVRMTPAPQLETFADFEFTDAVFRVHQQSTVINYKEFLERVEFAGLANFRAMVRHASRALPEGEQDLATKAFAETNGAAERFANRDELAAYDAAVTRGARAARVSAVHALPDDVDVPLALAAAPPAGTTDAQRMAEMAFQRMAVGLAREEAADRPGRSPVAGLSVVALGAMVMMASMAALLRSRNLPEGAPNVLPLVAIGLAAGLGLAILGMVYVSRHARDTREADGRVTSGRK